MASISNLAFKLIAAFAVAGFVLASAENKNKIRGSGTDPGNRI